MKSPRKREVFVVLHNIRSVFNVGSIFRTSDCLGVTNVILTGYTPEPIDRFGRLRKDFAKVALGAEVAVPWEKFKKFSVALEFLRCKKVRVIAVEQSSNSQDYRKVKPGHSVAFVFGNEVSGISPAVLKKCDIIAEIPMAGVKESLNVSVAAGIALSRILGC
jgi:tRNA G18 (ribose-2'-O)-methylase SpoU